MKVEDRARWASRQIPRKVALIPYVLKPDTPKFR
jgi:hypothetical protein